MSPTDLPQVPSEHSGTIIGGNWPQTSETGTVTSVIELYRRAAESVGTGDTAETMQALIEANASGQTPTNLIEHFTSEQRAAFDRALAQLNQGQGASVMAQDILNTKVALNGTVTSFEAAVEELIAAAAAAPQTPKTQAEFERRYNELLDQAKQQADMLGKNHRSTQDSLVTSIQKGATPDIPSTMALTSPESPTVPGMPENALGSVLQNVAGQMLKPQNLPMPNLGQLSQSVSPIAQSAQAAIGQLMSSLGGGAGAGSGVPISDDALSVLSKASGIGEQDATLSGPASETGAGAAVGAGAGSNGAAAGRPATAGDPARTTLAAEAPDNAKAPLSAAAPQNATVAAPALESAATAPAAPAVTAAPSAHVPTTTLSSTDTAGIPDTLASARTHPSAGDAAVGAATLNPNAASAAAAAGGAAPMPMMPMMPMGGGFGAAPASAAAGSVSTLSSTTDAARKPFEPDRPAPSTELTDFGSDLKGLEHATDMQMVASSILAALVRVHNRAGVYSEVAVGVSATTAVFVTSDGLGFIPPGVRAAAHVAPLITMVPSDFIARWLGCDQPWRPLLEAAALDLVGPFEAVATTDSGAAAFGVLALTQEQIESVNITAGAKDRWFFDAVDVDDVKPALSYLESVWGRPLSSALELENAAVHARWTGDAGPGLYPRRWARYLIAAAAADLSKGDVDDARYALRSALRIPEIQEDRP